MDAIVNLLIGLTIAFLPLYTKVAALDISRISKDNLLVVLMGVFCVLLPEKKRQFPKIGLIAVIYGIFMLFWNQWHPLSIMVQMQTFYIAAGMLFFVAFYERHDKESEYLIIVGMAIGCITQSLIVILNFLEFPVYLSFIKLFSPDVIGKKIDFSGIGSLGNSNLLAAYVALTSIALFKRGWAYLLVLPAIALIIANSMMGYATILAGAIYFFNLKIDLFKKRSLYIGALFAMVLFYLTGLNGLDSSRFKAWKEIFSRVDFGHFLFGKGPGWFADHPVKLINASGVGEMMIQEHNEFISAFNFFGVIGLALIAPLFISYLGKRDKSAIFPSILFASFVNAYGHFNLHQSTTAIIIIVSACICLTEGET